MTCNVIFAGFGGQGVLTAGLLLAEIAMDAGLEVLWSPAYGGEMRGGKAYSMVMLSDRPILSPICDSLDVLVAMNGPALDFCGRLKPGGLLIINTSDTDAAAPPGFDERLVPLAALAEKAASGRGLNLVALGCVLGALKLFPMDAATKGIRDYFEKKGRPGAGDDGAAAFMAGYRACAEAAE